MKGILVEEFGGPEVCKYRTDLPIPEPNDNQIQVKVFAVGVNPLETYIRSGIFAVKPKLPYIPGKDSAGIVTKIGKNVTDFKVGERVYSVESVTGTYCEFTIIEQNRLFKLPDSLSFNEGSAIGVPYYTAYRALFTRANAKPCETCLIHGASGAVGIASIQLAKANGIKVIGTAGTENGLKLVKDQGADYVYNHRQSGYFNKIKQDFPNGVDIILEMSAHVNLNRDLELLKFKKGRVIVIGCRGAIEIDARLLMAKESTVSAVKLMASDDADYNEASSLIESLMKLNAIKPYIGKVYPLEQASKAQYDVINNSGSMGRLALKID